MYAQPRHLDSLGSLLRRQRQPTRQHGFNHFGDIRCRDQHKYCDADVLGYHHSDMRNLHGESGACGSNGSTGASRVEQFHTTPRARAIFVRAERYQHALLVRIGIDVATLRGERRHTGCGKSSVFANSGWHGLRVALYGDEDGL